MNAMDTFLERAWSDHAEQPAAVAARLSEGLGLAGSDDEVSRLAMLAHHVLGEHLGQWNPAASFLTALESRGVHAEGGAATLARCQASLRLCGDAQHDVTALSASDRCRVNAMAAANLAAREPARATALLGSAVVQANVLPDEDPGVRALAALGNNIAASLRELDPLGASQCELMVRAAQVARTQWERAGTWREVERAEYRLAVCWLSVGDAHRALQHAKTCDAIVRQHGAQPLELFFAAEALALAARRLGDEPGREAALATARSAFAALPPQDQAWCRTPLETLSAA